jgi:hypothetical protein
MILMIKWQQLRLLQPTVNYSINVKESREMIFSLPFPFPKMPEFPLRFHRSQTRKAQPGNHDSPKSQLLHLPMAELPPLWHPVPRS